MKKQILLLVLALLPMIACAALVEIDGIYYNLVNKTKQAEVTSNPNKYTGSVVIPKSVTYEDVEYSVTSIGKYAFKECYRLTSVTIGNSVKFIGNDAFNGCSLTSITIPNNVTTIGEYAFYGCSGLTSVHILDLEAWCKISFDNNTANPLYYAHHLFLNDKEIQDLVIPNSVTSIGSYAFCNCSGLTSVIIPNSVTTIGNFAFEACSGLISVTIGNGVMAIGENVFSDCSGLTSVTIPNSVTSIGKYAFSGCTGLTTVTIPNSVTEIGSWAFKGCSGLTSVTIPNSITSFGSYAFSGCSALTSVIIPNSVTSIGNGAFRDCSGLTSVTIPNSVNSISNSAFSGCCGLTSVTIPNSVNTIGKYAFEGCSGLTSVTIGSGIKTFSEYAFRNCTELTDVYCYAENVPSTSSNAFDGSYIEYATLYVPTASIDAYKAVEPWKSFKTIMGLDGTIPETPKCATPTISYGGKKLMFVCDTEDVEFVTEIKVADAGTFYDDRITLSATYEISVYATKAGYENSDKATATLVWANATFTDTTPEPTAISPAAEMAPVPVLIQSNSGIVTVQGAADGTPVSIYTTAGTQAGSAVSQNGRAAINTSLTSGSIAIIKIGTQSFKVAIK